MRCIAICAWVSVICTSCLHAAGAQDLRQQQAAFAPWQLETSALSKTGRFGPVGMGFELRQPGDVLTIATIEKGSPAEKSGPSTELGTGKLAVGQIVETINGQKVTAAAPRIQLGSILTKAEATDGVITLVVKDTPADAAQAVTVRIPVLGSYSKTWPLNCPKSDRIVRNLGDHLATKERVGVGGIGGLQLLFLLSTGEEKDLETARRWMKTAVPRSPGDINWYIGYGGVPLAEYYLRTGDESILPVIQKFVDDAVKNYSVAGWCTRKRGYFTYSFGGGRVNAAGIPVATLLILAKECGLEVDTHVLHASLKQFYRFSGRGATPYGDHRPATTFVDNGKDGAIAFGMAAAASLTPGGEESLYARARDAAGIKGFYSTSWMLHGHTGGGLGEIWRGAAMGLMAQSKPEKYREFMDGRKWFYDLSRLHDSTFGIVGGARYDAPNGWGMGMGLAYTIPRRKLQIAGAPRTPWCKSYRLPERPWGTEADDAFLSLASAEDPDGLTPDVDSETLATGSGLPLSRLVKNPDTPVKVLRAYVHHQDHDIRERAARALAGRGQGAVLESLLASKDPRVRRAALSGVLALPEVSEGMIQRAIAMVADPEESWWVTDQALRVAGKARAEALVPHMERLRLLIEHPEWWVRQSAMIAVIPLCIDEQHCTKVFPSLARALASNQRYRLLYRMGGFMAALANASPKVQQEAASMFAQAYRDFPAKGSVVVIPNPSAKGDIPHQLATYMSDLVGGLDKLYEVSRERFPNVELPHKRVFLAGKDLGQNPRIRKVLAPIIEKELVPEYWIKNRKALLAAYAQEVQSPYPHGGKVVEVVDRLAAIYKSAGNHDYGWHMFADLRQREWSYHSFDPIPAEQLAWDAVVCRYREVTPPTGMENWFATEFDPTKAGWQKGKGAFAQYNGKLQQTFPKCTDNCLSRGCYGGTEMQTLWEKEVLLLRGTFDIPKMKKGYRYRIRVNSGDHVGVGGGYQIFINGKQLVEQRGGNGWWTGGRPTGGFITKDFIKDFQGGKVTLAVRTFLRYNAKFHYKNLPTEKIPRGRISLHLEEMRLPPLKHLDSVKAMSMLSAQWQALQDPDDRERDPEQGTYRWNGKCVPNKAALGSWVQLGQVKSIDAFTPGSRLRVNKRWPMELEFKPGGTTSDRLFMWTGDILMDLNRNQALKMSAKTIDGADYLFVEAGGFNAKYGPAWRPPLYVMKRK